MHSQNIVFTGKNQVEVVSQPVSKPSTGQLLVETRASLISTGTECICLARNFEAGTHWDDWVKYPFHTGYCNAGVVLEVGPDTEGFSVGDRVASRAPHGERVIAQASSSLKIPDGVSDEDATWQGISGIVQGGVRRAKHTLGDAVVIIGLGLLGQLATQYVRASGAREIIVIDTVAARIEMAKSHGATLGLQMGVADAHDAVFEATQGRGADVVYDITGHPAVFPAALGLARRFGTLLLMGDAGDPGEQRLTGDVIRRGVEIVGTHAAHPPAEASDFAWWTHANMGQLFFAFLRSGQMRVGDLITHRYAPSQAPEAFEMLLTDRSRAMGVVLDWTR